MDDILDRSKLLKEFNDDERPSARDMLYKQFINTYNTYANRPYANIPLMEDVIDMYLYLGVEPPARVLNELVTFLEAGTTFSKLDIYMHLPEYEQVVKLLRPEYYAEEDPRKFNQFTLSQTIYNKAVQKHGSIKDDYKNTYSIWYIQYLTSKGLEPTDQDLLYLMEHAPAKCIDYLADNNLVVYYSHSREVLRASCKLNNFKVFKSVLRVDDEIEYAYEQAKKYNRTEMIEYLSPLMEDITSRNIVADKRMDIIERMAEVCPYKLSEIISHVIQHGWDKAFDYIYDKVKWHPYHLTLAYETNDKYMSKVYAKLAEETNPKVILCRHLGNYIFTKHLYALNPVDLSFVVEEYHRGGTELIDLYVDQGNVITKEKIRKVLTLGFDTKYIKYLIDKSGISIDEIMPEVVKVGHKAIFLALSDEMDKSYPGIAMRNNNKKMCLWLVSTGCPIDINDVCIMPEELKLKDTGVKPYRA